MTYDELKEDLSRDERTVLEHASALTPFSSGSYAIRTGLAEPRVRRILGDFAARGWTQLRPMGDGTGTLRGRGYQLTLAGFEARQTLRWPPKPTRKPLDLSIPLGLAIGSAIGIGSIALGLM